VLARNPLAPKSIRHIDRFKASRTVSPTEFAMLRISVVTNPDATTIKLEGKLLGPWCDEVVRACRQATGASAGLPIRLDLHDVDYVDTDGLALIRSMRDGGAGGVVILSRCSNFVAELLQTEPV
jgi:ABC-type transporter Mla MlaB component